MRGSLKVHEIVAGDVIDGIGEVLGRHLGAITSDRGTVTLPLTDVVSGDLVMDGRWTLPVEFFGGSPRTARPISVEGRLVMVNTVEAIGGYVHLRHGGVSVAIVPADMLVIVFD
jgi:hypothetical protein